MQQAKRLRMPFDPFSNLSLNALNVIKSDASVKRKQMELVSRLKEATDPVQVGGLAHSIEQLTKALRN
jgi:hypothetical protein